MKTRPNLGLAIVGGFVGTPAMTVAVYLLATLLHVKMNIVDALAAMLGGGKMGMSTGDSECKQASLTKPAAIGGKSRHYRVNRSAFRSRVQFRTVVGFAANPQSYLRHSFLEIQKSQPRRCQIRLWS
jgi:hypothetical protein